MKTMEIILLGLVVLLSIACIKLYNDPSTKVRVKYAEIAAQYYLDGREDAKKSCGN